MTARSIITSTLLALISYQSATAQTGHKEIYACAQKNNGQLRVVSSHAECRSNAEIPISWNRTGEKGEKGDKGDPGSSSNQSTFSNEYQFVGLSAEKFLHTANADVSRFSANAACKSSFGEDARILTTREFLDSPNLPRAALGSTGDIAWIQASPVGGSLSSASAGGGALTIDASGASFSGGGTWGQANFLMLNLASGQIGTNHSHYSTAEHAIVCGLPKK